MSSSRYLTCADDAGQFPADQNRLAELESQRARRVFKFCHGRNTKIQGVGTPRQNRWTAREVQRCRAPLFEAERSTAAYMSQVTCVARAYEVGQRKVAEDQ